MHVMNEIPNGYQINPRRPEADGFRRETMLKSGLLNETEFMNELSKLTSKSEKKRK